MAQKKIQVKQIDATLVVEVQAGSNITVNNTDPTKPVINSTASGDGDVVGPGSSTDNAVARFDTTTGKIIQNSGVTIDDSNNISTSGNVDGRDVSADGTRLDTITDGNYKNSNTTKSQVGLSNVDNTSDASLTNTIISTIYPVGSLYTSTDATNPGTSLGVGTWAAFGQGRVLVGKASSGTFSSAGATVGTETHVLTISEMPAHTHSSGRTAGTSGSFGLVDSASASSSGTWNTLSTGGGGSHNNIQPSVVVYMWKRTA